MQQTVQNFEASY